MTPDQWNERQNIQSIYRRTTDNQGVIATVSVNFGSNNKIGVEIFFLTMPTHSRDLPRHILLLVQSWKVYTILYAPCILV